MSRTASSRRTADTDTAAVTPAARPGATTRSETRYPATEPAVQRAPAVIGWTAPASRPADRWSVIQRESDGVDPFGFVQAYGGETAGAGVASIAAAGVASASEPLPFADRIQAAFGRHDVGHVRAATGADASAASSAIGARAYATGDRVAFAGAPDLHTAAHEAAHVVQQRAGVSLKSGVGEAGDVYEQHADRVADLVVAGASAEAALDEMAGAGGSATTVVQRKDDDAPALDNPATATGTATTKLPIVIRTGPSTASARVSATPDWVDAGVTFSVFGVVDSWLQVQYQGQVAYITGGSKYVDYVETPAPATEGPATGDTTNTGGEDGASEDGGVLDAIGGALNAVGDAVSGAVETVTDTVTGVVSGGVDMVAGLLGLKPSEPSAEEGEQLDREAESPEGPATEEPATEEPAVDPDMLSGAHWRTKADNSGWTKSSDVGDLASPFQTGVREFIAALEAAGASVAVDTTWRSPERAWLMHWAWKIGIEGKAPPTDDPHGLGIVWDHGDPAATKAGAVALKEAFHMDACASLTSRHIFSNAIDMAISWSGTLTIANKDGSTTTIESAPRDGLNTELHKVGATYGVLKLVKIYDPPHWSDNAC